MCVCAEGERLGDDRDRCLDSVDTPSTQPSFLRFSPQHPAFPLTVNMAARLMAVAALAVVSAAHECVHDALQETLALGLPHEERHLATSAPQQYNFTLDQHGRALQSTTFSSIRIKVDVSRLLR